ncbi:pentatricopeptide repeat-containing protein At1g62680, mitochondrial-like [Abrus precatorius]|uniref:Pentatricopeptide repeat-containing protein At1g62680, mitochondrial-like n=1 Tax=Abrus precatorius TaxID=3816 RepID=A0A8B8LN54_ABRPR|nr:pentatricopeptide repeat-containing protein At1g62680, mitochondrial-like [Abrus precatorius]
MKMLGLRFVDSVSLTPSIPKFLNFHPARFYSQSQPTFIHYLNDAVASFNRILKMRPKLHITEFNKILVSLVKMKNYPIAISLSQKLGFVGIMPTLATFNILINCCCQMHQITFAFSILSKTLKMGYQHDTRTFNTLMNGMCISGKVKEALYFHDNVVAQGFELNQASYGILINGLCKVGERRIALQLLRKIEGHSINPDRISADVITYTSLIYGFCVVGRLKEAIDLFKEMALQDINPNLMKETMYSTIWFHRCCQMAVMVPNGGIYGSICALFDKDENDKAEKLLRQMIDGGLWKD